MANLRTRCFTGLYAFMYFAAITINLLLLFQAHVLRGTALGQLGLPCIINRLVHVAGQVQVNRQTLSIGFPELHPYTRRLLNPPYT